MVNFKQYQFSPQEEAKYQGEYIVVTQGKIVAHGKTVDEVMKKVKGLSEKVVLTKVRKEGLMVV